MIPIIDKRQTGIKIRTLMDKKRITVRQVQEYLELASVQSVYHWLNGISLPTVDNLYALSELLSVPVDDLICGDGKCTFKQTCDKCVLNVQVRRIYAYYIRMSRVA